MLANWIKQKHRESPVAPVFKTNFNGKNVKKKKKKKKIRPVMVSQHFGRPRWVDQLRSGVQEQPGQHGETLSLLKIHKLAGCDGRCLQSQLLRRLRWSDRLRSKVLDQPGPQGETLSLLKIHKLAGHGGVCL